MSTNSWEDTFVLSCFDLIADYWYLFLIGFILLLFLCRNKPCPRCNSRSLLTDARASMRVNKERGGAVNRKHVYSCGNCGLFYDPSTGLADDPQPKKIVIVPKEA